MKFLCVPCDSPMKLQSVAPPDRGSLSVVYACPECGYEMAMLTNAYETQVVQSLGVRIGPEGTGNPGEQAASNCPFVGMIPGVGSGEAASQALRPGSGQAGEPFDSSQGKPIPVRWTAAAEARLAKIPEFVRERGAMEVDEKILDAAKDFFGM
jgi:hypothetical protein